MNAGKYRTKIKIYSTTPEKDKDGYQTSKKTLVLAPRADIKTTKGYTLIRNGSDFEKAYTNFTIRYPRIVIDRDMIIEYHGKVYTIEYLNNVDEKGVELEIQAKEVTH